MSKCEICGRELLYDERWDAYFCKKCNEWKQEQCDDPECYHCANRPYRPVEIW